MMKLHEVNNNSVMDLVDQSEEKTFEEIMRAVEEGRIIQGVFECAHALEMDPDGVQVCVVSDGGDNDISVHIQHTLIEAYCWENEISFLKVGPQDKLSAILANKETNLNKNVEDHSCALIMVSKKDTNNESLDQDTWTKSDTMLPG